MKRNPTGRLIPTAEGRDLVIVRTFRAPIEDVWASITESERTARWIGSWTGTPGRGRKIQFSMGFEGGEHVGDITINECDAPRHLSITTTDASGAWQLEAHLTESDGVTEMRFTHHLDATIDPGSVGPGWEYYLDMLEASRDGTETPEWNDYYPVQSEHYTSQVENATQST